MEACAPANIEANSLPTHVALCSERYEKMQHRLERIERHMSWGGSVVILTLITIAIRLWMPAG